MCQRKEEEVVHWVVRIRMVHSRMVRENPLDFQNRKQKHNPETQGEGCQEAAGTSSESLDAESRDLPDSQLELHNWNREPETPEEHDRRQTLKEADSESLPTHLRPFSSPEEYTLVKQTYRQLQHSGYYWGALSMEEAHAMLSDAPLGTFLISFGGRGQRDRLVREEQLIRKHHSNHVKLLRKYSGNMSRDSVQPDVFFTLSYRSDEGPTSVRVMLNKKLLFSLFGSNKTFDSLFTLLTHYTGSSCKLTAPHRKQRPERLTEICRRALVRTFGAENLRTLSELSSKDKNYIYLYPYSI